MAFDFPNTPVVGDRYTAHGITYSWNGYAWINVTGDAAIPTEFVLKTGDTMSGPLLLSGSPTLDLHAATKAYVDAAFPAGTGVVGQVLAINAASAPQYGAPIDCGTF